MSDEKEQAAPHIETSPASPEIELGMGDAALPGAHKGGFQRLPTAPVNLPATDVGPSEDLPPLPDAEWVAPVRVRHGMSGWALGLAVMALGASFFVGWTFPLGLAAAIVSIVALRRPWDSRVVAGWALALSILSVLYSAGWLLWLAHQQHLVS
ncbi:hypothetical protein ET475_02675 [Microbacterium protaetiae]|uniref:Uncharacterized protein n=1 Tax=Microbacterium protaetiae TaxID=2509458 RepID=A0A4P6EAK7_9MICO|nr:hypothetical protein [Microbacterium protaetiae]QAY59004.1 hypothetical protein ET475_02675 [Microbacterium protaetiae]